MDKLKQIIQSKKPQSKMVEQRDIIAKEKIEYMKRQEEEKRVEEEQKLKRYRQLQDFYEYDVRRKLIKTDTVEQIVMSVDEVKQRLREMHQPITLFGQTSNARFKRFAKIQEFYQKNPNYDMKTYDQEFLNKVKEQEEFTELDAKYRARLIQPRLGDDPKYLKSKMEMISTQKQQEFENVCDEIYLWGHKILRDWSQALEQKYNSEELRKTHDSFIRYQDTVDELKSFFHVLKKRVGDRDMIISIYHIMNCCLIRQYIKANDRYIDLSIGKAPWPMGIAMLGITVRRNDIKVSHVLGEQMTRKWMQCIKRLISISQELYPNEDMNKAVGYSVQSMI